MSDPIKAWQNILQLVREYEFSKTDVPAFPDDAAFIEKMIADGYTLTFHPPGWEKEAAMQVIKYLNGKAGSSFIAVNNKGKLTASGTIVISRIKEGFTMEDMKTVIDRKCTQWLNTNEAKWLRPETLFNRTKFESYLGAANNGQQSITSTKRGFGQFVSAVRAAQDKLLNGSQD
jgi:uncharacterized phage protein (TIGR02220 family)